MIMSNKKINLGLASVNNDDVNTSLLP